MAHKLLLVYLLFISDGFQSLSITTPSKTKLVIDHDGGADDAMAIFMSLLYEKYFDGPQVVALTLTHGNVNESQVFINSQRILDKACRRDVKIYRGAKRALVTPFPSDFYFGMDGLGDNARQKFKETRAQNCHAAFALIELSKKYKDNLVVMAIASMTNIALAARIDPDFIGRLKHLYVGAGNLYSHDSTEPEFNAEMDVEAYHIVVDNTTPDKVTVIPFSQTMETLNITNEWRKDVLGAIPTPIMEAQNSYERISLASSSSWSLLDPAVAAIVLDSTVVKEYKLSHNSIILCGDKRGINTNNLESSEPNVRLVYAAKEDRYKQLLIDIFSAELK